MKNQPNMEFYWLNQGCCLQKGYAQTQSVPPSRNSLMFGQNGARQHFYNRDAERYKKTNQLLTIPAELIKQG